MSEPQPGTPEEDLIHNLWIAEKQLKAAVDAAAKGGIDVDFIWTGIRSDRLTECAGNWMLALTKTIDYPGDEVSP